MLEKSTIFLHRLKILYDSNRELPALKFLHIAILFYENRLRKNRIPHFFLDEDYVEMRDIYYALLLFMQQNDMINQIVCLLGIILFNYK